MYVAYRTQNTLNVSLNRFSHIRNMKWTVINKRIWWWINIWCTFFLLLSHASTAFFVMVLFNSFTASFDHNDNDNSMNNYFQVYTYKYENCTKNMAFKLHLSLSLSRFICSNEIPNWWRKVHLNFARKVMATILI